MSPYFLVGLLRGSHQPVESFLDIFHRHKAGERRSGPFTAHSHRRVKFTDLFFWAVLSGQPQLVKRLWECGQIDDPFRAAVVGVEARAVPKPVLTRARMQCTRISTTVNLQ